MNQPSSSQQTKLTIHQAKRSSSSDRPNKLTIHQAKRKSISDRPNRNTTSWSDRPNHQDPRGIRLDGWDDAWMDRKQTQHKVVDHERRRIRNKRWRHASPHDQEEGMEDQEEGMEDSNDQDNLSHDQDSHDQDSHDQDSHGQDSHDQDSHGQDSHDQDSHGQDSQDSHDQDSHDSHEANEISHAMLYDMAQRLKAMSHQLTIEKKKNKLLSLTLKDCQSHLNLVRKRETIQVNKLRKKIDELRNGSDVFHRMDGMSQAAQMMIHDHEKQWKKIENEAMMLEHPPESTMMERFLQNYGANGYFKPDQEDYDIRRYCRQIEQSIGDLVAPKSYKSLNEHKIDSFIVEESVYVQHCKNIRSPKVKKFKVHHSSTQTKKIPLPPHSRETIIHSLSPPTEHQMYRGLPERPMSLLQGQMSRESKNIESDENKPQIEPSMEPKHDWIDLQLLSKFKKARNEIYRQNREIQYLKHQLKSIKALEYERMKTIQSPIQPREQFQSYPSHPLIVQPQATQKNQLSELTEKYNELQKKKKIRQLKLRVETPRPSHRRLSTPPEIESRPRKQRIDALKSHKFWKRQYTL